MPSAYQIFVQPAPSSSPSPPSSNWLFIAPFQIKAPLVCVNPPNSKHAFKTGRPKESGCEMRVIGWNQWNYMNRWGGAERMNREFGGHLALERSNTWKCSGLPTALHSSCRLLHKQTQWQVIGCSQHEVRLLATLSHSEVQTPVHLNFSQIKRFSKDFSPFDTTKWRPLSFKNRWNCFLIQLVLP